CSRGRGRGRWLFGLVPALFALALALPAEAQQTRVSGTVTSAETGGAMAGVNVTVKGTTIGTLTNSDGGYSLLVPTPNDTLIFALIGHQEMEEAINGRSNVSVVLEVQAVALQELV